MRGRRKKYIQTQKPDQFYWNFLLNKTFEYKAQQVYPFCLQGDLIVLRRIDERRNSIESYCEIRLKQNIVMSSSYLKNLSEHIVKFSVSNDFITAKEEWQLDHIKITKEFGKCPCGHAIKEHCYIRNNLNNNMTHVGNECIKKFMKMDTGNLFSGLHRINKNQTTKPNSAVIDYAYGRGYLQENQHQFLQQIKSKRRQLTDKQKEWLQFINNKILNDIVVRRLPN